MFGYDAFTEVVLVVADSRALDVSQAGAKMPLPRGGPQVARRAWRVGPGGSCRYVCHEQRHQCRAVCGHAARWVFCFHSAPPYCSGCVLLLELAMAASLVSGLQSWSFWHLGCLGDSSPVITGGPSMIFIESVLGAADLDGLERNVLGVGLWSEVETWRALKLLTVSALMLEADIDALERLPECLDRVSPVMPVESGFFTEMSRRLDPVGRRWLMRTWGCCPACRWH